MLAGCHTGAGRYPDNIRYKLVIGITCVTSLHFPSLYFMLHAICFMLKQLKTNGGLAAANLLDKSHKIYIIVSGV